MTLVGIRQLRQNASAYLRRVKAGETIQIADRGRAVALWVPIPDTGGLARLDAELRLSEAQGDVLELGPPLEPSPAGPLPSKALSAAREHER
jgi:antitoxin (DNA-binding transcriptional repressor) of toxin-antitoxin stability system